MCPCPSVITDLALSLGLAVLEGSFSFRGRKSCWVRSLMALPVWPWHFSLLMSLGSRPRCLKRERAHPANSESTWLCSVPGWQKGGEQRVLHFFRIHLSHFLILGVSSPWLSLGWGLGVMETVTPGVPVRVAGGGLVHSGCRSCWVHVLLLQLFLCDLPLSSL